MGFTLHNLALAAGHTSDFKLEAFQGLVQYDKEVDNLDDFRTSLIKNGELNLLTVKSGFKTLLVVEKSFLSSDEKNWAILTRISSGHSVNEKA